MGLLVIEVVALELSHVPLKGRNILSGDTVVDGNLKDISSNDHLVLGFRLLARWQENQLSQSDLTNGKVWL